ncbi:MAG: cbb3-type cytochrome c oxidase subunit I [Verrucomicrobiota bacterium]
MRLILNIFSSIFPNLEEKNGNRETERVIDASIRLPVLGMIKASIAWLAFALILGICSSMQLHDPTFGAGSSILTYGKVNPAFWNALVYGWAFNAAWAVGAWILVRLSGVALTNGFALIVSSTAWNIGLTIGIFGIFIGHQNPYKFLEMPSYVMPFILVSFVATGVWGLMTFKARLHRSSYASQWYLIVALFAFAWLFMGAQAMLFYTGVQGSFQYLVGSWYADGLINLAIAPVAFATLYYLIPKTLGTHVLGYRYSGSAFWFWILFASASGVSLMVNGPIPAWVASAGVIASFGLMAPGLTLGMQFFSSCFSQFERVWETVSMRFVFMGLIGFAYYLWHVCFGSLRISADTVQFTTYESGVQFVGLVGFAGMIFTGATYFILPRLLNKNIPQNGMVELQYWLQILGTITVAVGMIYGGESTGELMNQSTASVATIQKGATPYHVAVTFGFVMLLIAAVAYAINFAWLLASDRSEEEESAELIGQSPDLEYKTS